MPSSSSDRGLRFLLIVENLPVPFDRRVWQQACTLRDAGHAVTVLCPATRGYPAGDHRVEGIRVRRHPLPEASGAPGYLLEYAWALMAEAWLTLKTRLSGGFDLIQVANPPDLLCLVAWPYKALGVPLVYDQHDLAPELFEAKFGRRGFFHRLLRGAESLSFRLADHVLATNASYRRRALERGVAEDRVTVVRNGPDLNRLSPGPGDPAWKGEARYLLVYAGLMGSQDGLPDLVAVMSRLREDHRRRDVRLVLAGDGPARPEVEALVEEKGLEECVTFAGMLGDRELAGLLNAADLCLAPDPKNPMNDQSTMLKTMEYLAVGKPVVQYDLHEGRATAEGASLYARPGDPDHFARLVHELLEDEARRAAMGAEGLSRVREVLQWSKQAPVYVSVLESLARRRRSSP